MTPHALETKAVVSVFVCFVCVRCKGLTTADKSEAEGGVSGTEGRGSEPASEASSGCSCQPLFLLSLEAHICFPASDLHIDAVSFVCALCTEGS